MIVRYQLRCGHTIAITDITLPRPTERRRGRQRTIADWWCRECQGAIPIESQIR